MQGHFLCSSELLLLYLAEGDTVSQGISERTVHGLVRDRLDPRLRCSAKETRTVKAKTRESLQLCEIVIKEVPN